MLEDAKAIIGAVNFMCLAFPYVIESHKIMGLEDTMVERSVHSHIHIPSPALSMWVSPCWPISSIFGLKTVHFTSIRTDNISPLLNDHTRDNCAIREIQEKGIVLRTLVLVF